MIRRIRRFLPALRLLPVLGLAAVIAVTRACGPLVPDPLRGPAPQVHPAIRAWDAGARDR